MRVIIFGAAIAVMLMCTNDVRGAKSSRQEQESGLDSKDDSRIKSIKSITGRKRLKNPKDPSTTKTSRDSSRSGTGTVKKDASSLSSAHLQQRSGESLKMKTRAGPLDKTLLSIDARAWRNLTITSVAFNAVPRVSEWVDKLFGSKAIFYNKTNPEAGVADKIPLSREEINDRFVTVRNHFRIPSYAIMPPCSFEALGYVMLRAEDSGPFAPESRNEIFIGRATFNLPNRKTTFHCFYRPLFENWRGDNPWSAPNFWSVIFYCPAERKDDCDYLDYSLFLDGKYNRTVHSEDGYVVLRTPPFRGETELWRADFQARPFLMKDEYLFRRFQSPVGTVGDNSSESALSSSSQSSSTSSGSAGSKSGEIRNKQDKLNQKEQAEDAAALSSSRYDTIQSINAKVHAANAFLSTSATAAHASSTIGVGGLPMAICLVIPYTSSDTAKTVANGAMLLEWIRYHAMLGFKIIIYDRDGANEEHIYNSKYGSAQKIRIPRGKLVYHPYTIRGVLDPSRKGMKYDNTDAGFDRNESDYRRNNFESQGHDKVLTLTHCRFEAKTVYGIENVFVADFDEFLYCPVAAATVKAQVEFLGPYLQRLKANGVEQIEFAQRVVANKTDNPRNCVVEKVNKGESLFDCFSSYEFYNGAHSIKCIHLGHGCPLTGYHQACPSEEVPRTHDCLCNSVPIYSNNYRFYISDELKEISRTYAVPRGRECAVVHLSTNVGRDYGRYEYVFTEDQIEGIEASRSELWYIANSRRGKSTPHTPHLAHGTPHLRSKQVGLMTTARDQD